MPLFDYACGGGHVTERFYGMGEAPHRVRCWCRKLARRVYSTVTVCRGACAFEPHYNPCLDAVVTSEREMRDVEKKLEDTTGIRAVPYEPVRKRPDNWKETGLRAHQGAELANAATEEIIPGDGVPEGGGWGREFEGEDGVAEEVTM